jgi:hypothetical protein
MSVQVLRTGSAEYGRWIKMLVVGTAGAGKSLLSSTFPYPFFISAEGGLMSIADRHIPYINLESSDQLFEILNIMMLSPKEREATIGARVDTVVIDTIDEVQRLFQRERLAALKQDQFKLADWTWLNENMQSVSTGFRNLDTHVVFTCHVKENRDEELGRITYKPGLQGQFADYLPGAVDLALHLTSELRTIVDENQTTKKLFRTLHTLPDAHHEWVKDRSGKLPAEFEINFKDDFARMNDLIFSGIDQSPREVEAAPLPIQNVDQESVDEIVPTPTVEPGDDDLQAAATLVVDAFFPPDIGVADGLSGDWGPSAVEVQNTAALGETCEECGFLGVDEDQAALSQIRARRTLCKPCYKTLKAAGLSS